MKIKSLTIIAVLVVAILCFGVGASAQTTSVQALIAQLQAQIVQLTAQLNALLAKQNSGQSIFSQLAPNVFLANDSSGNFVSDTGNIDFGGLTKNFYSAYPDTYDFIAYIPNFDDGLGYDFNQIINNNIKGIGIPSYGYNNSAAYGSSNLKSIVLEQNIDNLHSQATGGPVVFSSGNLSHELSHYWLMYLLNYNNLQINRDGAHWSPFVDTSTRTNGLTYVSPNGGHAYKDNGDGTFSLDESSLAPGNHYKFNSAELYLMGLLPSSGVKPLDFWDVSTTGATFSATAPMAGIKKEVTITDIINDVGPAGNGGPRIPAFPNTQKDFKVAFVLLSHGNQAATDIQKQTIEWIANNFPAEWNSSTNGLSTINNSTPACTPNWQCTPKCVGNAVQSVPVDLNNCGTQSTITACPLVIKNCPNGCSNGQCNPSVCTSNWQCNLWNTCTNGQQSRNCTDANNCGTTTGKPITVQPCVNPPIACNPNWTCGTWSTCMNNQQNRTCADSNSCGATTGEPALTQSCASITQPSITVTSPNGGEQITLGKPFNVSWQSSGVTNIDIYFWFSDGGTCFLTTVPASQYSASITVNNGYQCPGITKQITPGQYKIRMYGDKNGAIDGASANYFTVNASTTSYNISQNQLASIADVLSNLISQIKLMLQK